MKPFGALLTVTVIVTALGSLPIYGANSPSFPTMLLDSTLGKAPDNYKKGILADTKKFRAALEKSGRKKTDDAKAKLRALKNSYLKDYALLELTRLEVNEKNYHSALALISELQHFSFPPSVDRTIADWEKEMLFGQALQKAEKAKTRTEKKHAISELQYAFGKTPYREWDDRGDALTELLRFMKSVGDPLWKNQLSEALLALPANSLVRKKITEGISAKEIQELTMYPRFRAGAETVNVPVKAAYPDQDLFDQGMGKILDEDWSGAQDLFDQIMKLYPSSELADRAQYWIARSLEARDHQEDAKKKYAEIFQASPLSFYGLEAALRSGQEPLAGVKDVEPEFAPLAGSFLPRQQLGLWRLRAFLETGLLEYAAIQMEDLFNYRPNGLFGQDDPHRALSLAFLYHWSGYHLGAFTQAFGATSLDKTLLTKKTLDIIFPNPFDTEIEKAAEAVQVNPLLVRSLMKQESAFLPQALSHSNAIGLMQLLLSTARDVEQNVSRTDLFDPKVNSRIGSSYLRFLLDRFDGNIPIALAAYNAGPARAAQWQKRLLDSSLMKKGFQADVFIDTIPFTETRRYVGSILRNYWWYRALNGKAAKSVEELVSLWQKNEQQPKP